jgi:hypothetical protein
MCAVFGSAESFGVVSEADHNIITSGPRCIIFVLGESSVRGNSFSYRPPRALKTPGTLHICNFN